MRKAIVIVVAFVALTVAGCKSKQDQLVELNAQFDSQNAQYQKNCLLAPAEVTVALLLRALRNHGLHLRSEYTFVDLIRVG